MREADRGRAAARPYHEKCASGEHVLFGEKFGVGRCKKPNAAAFAHVARLAQSAHSLFFFADAGSAVRLWVGAIKRRERRWRAATGSGARTGVYASRGGKTSIKVNAACLVEGRESRVEGQKATCRRSSLGAGPARGGKLPLGGEPPRAYTLREGGTIICRKPAAAAPAHCAAPAAPAHYGGLGEVGCKIQVSRGKAERSKVVGWRPKKVAAKPCYSRSIKLNQG